MRCFSVKDIRILFRPDTFEISGEPYRGALQGRADKGLFITTGTFTRDATKETQRDGAPPIDLIDGDNLAQKLKELALGIKVEYIERVDIDKNWFSNI